MHVSNSFLILGVVGLLGSTLGTSVLAWCISRFSRSPVDAKKSTFSSQKKFNLDILIPAHNEEALIGKTLISIADASKRLSSENLAVSITVGLDHTTDQTLNRIHHFIYYENTDVTIVENRGEQGKWNLLNQLVEESTADWVALVDSGTTWDRDLLKEVLPKFDQEEIVGVAPSYQAAHAGLLERLNWRLERTLKNIESSAGGPISVHGATVFYERKMLIQALQKLKGTHWLNDDVVIPLTLRTLSPQKKLVYLPKNSNGSAWITDIGIKRSDARSDFRRRRRMIFGNLQWIDGLLKPAFQSSFTVGLIASRRVFRTFWAYAALSLIIGLIVNAVRFIETPSVLFLSMGSLFLIGFLYRMRSAFWAGLEIPFQFFSTQPSSSRKSWN